MLLAILNRVNVIVAIVGGILNGVQSLQQVIASFNIPAFEQAVTSQLGAIQGALSNVSSNQAADVLRLEADIAAIQSSVQALGKATGIPQQAGQPVVLPRTPPAGYGGASSSSVADAVWAYPLPNATPFTALEAQDSTMGHYFFLSNNNAGYPILGNPGYQVVGADSEPIANFSGPNQGFLDFTTILPTDATIFAWAHRVYPTSPWQHGPNGTVFERDSANGAITWYVDLNEQQFRQWKAVSAAAARVAPVWPGLANVTLGTTVALADQLVVAGPMDGVVVHITATPFQKTHYLFASTEDEWFRVGAVTFRDDRGDYERPQLLGFDHALYTPHAMQHAAAAAFRTAGALTGTVTPWTAN